MQVLVFDIYEEQKCESESIITPSDFARYLKANLDTDDINAKILQSMREEQQKEESKSTKKAIINKTDSSQQKWPGT